MTVDLLKILISNNRLSSKNQITLIIDTQRNILKHFRIVGDHFAYFSISARDCLLQRSILIGQHDRQPIQFPAKQSIFVAKPVFELLPLFGLAKGQHRTFMCLFGQLVNRLISDANRRASRQYHACFLF